jgi:ABC-type bacteriocin/lantibiotic exporter with double-glycine peptidase domain
MHENNVSGRLLGDINVIYIDKISFSYNDKVLYQDLSLTIHKGESIVITGGIGSGKSTLLKLLMKYYIPSSGEIYFNNIPYSQLSSEYIRQSIGIINQDPVLFNRSILENILYGSNNKTEKDVVILIKKLELENLFSRFQDGLKFNVGKSGSYLSGGERQIIILLRTLLQNPPIILLDEPTSSLDKDTREIVYKIIDNMTLQNKTIIATTHDSDMMKYFNRSIVIEKGTVVSDTKLRD